MSIDRFIDIYIPEQIPGYPCISSPRWSTDIVISDSGAERVNQRWSHPLHTFILPDAIRHHEDIEGIHDHWMTMRGPLYTFPFSDPMDFASVPLEYPNVEPTITSTDQTIGSGDGVTQQFQITKTYTRQSTTDLIEYTRNIYVPVVDSLLVSVGGADTTAYSVDRETGIITFDSPPSPGAAIKCGYYFDVPVRFESDDAFEGIVQTFQVSGAAKLVFVEVRQCA